MPVHQCLEGQRPVLDALELELGIKPGFSVRDLSICTFHFLHYCGGRIVRAEASLWEWVLCVDGVRLGGKGLYPLSHLTSS